jgi:hypothetical protein
MELKKAGASGRWRAHGRRSAETAGPRPATTGFARGRALSLSSRHAPAIVSTSTMATTITLRIAMADRIELFERRNRVRIVALVFLATLNYIVAVIMAAIALASGSRSRSSSKAATPSATPTSSRSSRSASPSSPSARR